MATGPKLKHERIASNGRHEPYFACKMCGVDSLKMKSSRDFASHLRDFHCTKEGGSYVCSYGPHGVCSTLPVEGVSDRDYDAHLMRDHMKHGEPGFVSRESSKEIVGDDSCSEPNVVQDQKRWTIYMSQVNLPAALNDPRVGRRETDIFAKTWGESFERADVQPSPHLKVITKDHFKKYLKKTASRLADHAKNTENTQEQQSQDNSEDGYLAQKGLRKQDDLILVPKIFSLPNFSLENPDTFNAVFPWSQIEEVSSPDKGKKNKRSSSKLLQEKLSHYLDIVEVHIAKQISLKSEAFFHAVSSHDKLQEDMANTCASIVKLRERVHQLQSEKVQGPLNMMRLSARKANYTEVYNKLKMMYTVQQTQPTIQALLATNEFVGALDLIATTQEVLVQELAGIHSFRHLGSQLAEIEKVIDKMIDEDFIKCITADLNRPLSPEDAMVDEEKLASITFGMLRQRKYNFMDVYREEAFASIKAIVKQSVIESVTSAELNNLSDNGVASLADQMRLMDYQSWMHLLHFVFSQLLLALKRSKTVINVMDEITQMAAGYGRGLLDQSSESLVLFDRQLSSSSSLNPNESAPTTPTTPLHRLSMTADVDVILNKEECAKVTANLQDTMCQICDHAHDRCCKLLVARAKDGFLERLSSSEFVELSRAIERFVLDCEVICGRKSSSLRTCLQGQASRYVSRFHDEKKNKMSLILDNERWKQADVPSEFQALFSHIINTGTLTLPDKTPVKDSPPSEFLVIDGQKYAVVGTVLLLLKMVVEYCEVVNDIPTMTPDVLSRLIELLKLFNSRTCQLILGAGAVQLVGLKTITTKNLGLAARCLELVIYFLPMVRHHFETRLSSKQSNRLKHFDHVIKDYTDHVAEIKNKLVAIMENMLENCLSKWEVKAPMPSTCFRRICQQMARLHEAVSDLMPEDQVLGLFTRIQQAFEVQLRGQLIKLGVTNDGGPQHGLVLADLGFYSGQLHSLASLDKLDLHMNSIWDKR